MARISKEEMERIRLKIIKVASRFFIENGYEETSTKKIAKEVGIAEGTLFNYFDSKAYLFLESIGYSYETRDVGGMDYSITSDIAEVLSAHMKKTAGVLLKIPKGILTELVIASIKMAKKHPKRFKQFAELDFKYMRDIEGYIQELVDQELLKEVNAKLLSEVVYSIMAYEILMYMYDKETTSDNMFKNIKEKVELVISGYTK